MLTVDPFTVLVAEESDDFGDIRRDSTSPKRAEFGNACLDVDHAGIGVGSWGVMPSVCVEHVRFDATGSNRIDRDALGTGVCRERPSETLDGCLGSRIQSMVFDAGHVRSNGRHEDYTAPVCVPPVSINRDPRGQALSTYWPSS